MREMNGSRPPPAGVPAAESVAAGVRSRPAGPLQDAPLELSGARGEEGRAGDESAAPAVGQASRRACS